ncbi:MAG: cytochrome c oxidase subunit II [Cyanobacteria bacterium J06639_1]
MNATKILQVLGTIAAIAISGFVSFWYGQNNGLLPTQASTEAPLIDGLFNSMMVVVTAIFLLVQGVVIYSLIRFRKPQGDETDGPHLEGNVLLEMVWTVIPAVIVLWLAIYSYDIYDLTGKKEVMAHVGGHDAMVEMAAYTPGDDPNGMLLAQAGADEEEPMVVQVAGMQYAWIFTYPDSGVVTGELHVPTDRKVRLDMSANDVLHAFWLPEFRIKQDTIPGRTTELSFTPTVAGTYPVICAELCGPYHGVMRTQMIVHDPADFTAWYDTAKVELAGVDPDALATRLSQQAHARAATRGFDIDASTLADVRGQIAELHHSGSSHPSSSFPSDRAG